MKKLTVKNERGNMKIKKFTKTEKVLIGTAIVCTCAAGYFGYKYGLRHTFNALADKNNALESKIKVLQEAASEGLYEEAIATVTRKINHIKDQVAYCTDRLSTNTNDFQTENALASYTAKLDVLMARKNNFVEAQKTYELIVD